VGGCFFTSLFSNDEIIPSQVPSTLIPGPKDAFEDVARAKGMEPPRWLLLSRAAQTRLSKVFGRFHLDLGSLRFALRAMQGHEG
jgi:hypothetical protein